ncbi:MAG: ABC transporter permease [Actinomycetota bacterium]
MTAIWALVKVQLKILVNDPWFLVIMFGMPLVVMPLFQQVIGASLEGEGFEGASGAELVVPGQMVLFGFFVAGSVGFSVYREHGWKTWDRLRSSAASPRALLAGFAIPWIAIHVLYSLALLVVGGLLVGLRLNGGSPFAVLLVLFAYASCVIALMLLATATFRTVNQLNGLQNVGAMVFAGLGGAIVPFEQLPGWAQVIGPFTPAYWAMRGHRAVFLEQGGVGDVVLPVAVLLAAGVVLGALGAIRFRADETKEFFA